MPASPSTARVINDRLALELLQREGPLTAGQLKAMTGLSRPTVADLVERLQGTGLVTVVGEAGAERRGPNARLYGIVADRAHLAALDVRTRSVTVVVADLLGATLARASLPIGGDTGTEPAVEQAAALLERTAARAGADRLHSVGIGAPGLIDPASGELRETTGLPAWHRRLVTALQDRLSARVLVENETNLAALAEQRSGGAAGDRESFAFLWLGHGVGAGLVLDGRLRRGSSGGAGEIGFLPVPGTGGTPSSVDCEGGFHSLVGSAAVCALAERHGLPPRAHDGTSDAAQAVAEAVAGGHTAFLDELAGRLALGAAAVVSVLDPGCVVLGGEVGHAGGPELAARVGAGLAAMSPLPTEVRPGALGGDAVLRGALLMAQEAAQDELFTGGTA
ncbi:ROK family transcriptional regulator [Streptomyces genisteinicus]|uniref:ROK family transcriptional regulator n=1 Tax=Streptomyces genisteinicus TaxID=2768068 RepID=A0A7H0HP14_9ACTN|nr:ROK family transcriptional regulator [Streptomyces genisteinicus]QNP62280.1 ROK family transcriptional regulator [Streptomyces genisteinicus]